MKLASGGRLNSGTGFEEFAASIFRGGADPLKARFSIFREVRGFYKVFKVYAQLWKFQQETPPLFSHLSLSSVSLTPEFLRNERFLHTFNFWACIKVLPLYFDEILMESIYCQGSQGTEMPLQSQLTKMMRMLCYNRPLRC